MKKIGVRLVPADEFAKILGRPNLVLAPHFVHFISGRQM
jgi:hypothetical protein